jgi:hypothetical protein
VEKKKVLEAEERVLSTRHDASVAPSNTGVPAAEIDEEDETPDKRRRDDDVSGAQSNAGESAEMDEGEDEDETPNKRTGDSEGYDETGSDRVTVREVLSHRRSK